MQRRVPTYVEGSPSVGAATPTRANPPSSVFTLTSLTIEVPHGVSSSEMPAAITCGARTTRTRTSRAATGVPSARLALTTSGTAASAAHATPQPGTTESTTSPTPST